MCERHPHADVIIAWAEGKPIQQIVNGKWCDVIVENPNFHSGLKFRIKPEPVEVISCNDLEITPMKERPEANTRYYLADPTIPNLCQEYIWRNDDSDKRFFTRGLVHKTAQSAYAHAQAMLNNKKELQYV